MPSIELMFQISMLTMALIFGLGYFALREKK